MKKTALLMLLLFTGYVTQAQQWSVYGGAAADYDGFLRDASVTSVKNKWPFSLGGSVVLGGGYKARNGFDFFATANLGIANLKLPIPDVAKSEEYLGLLMARLMFGAGPSMSVGEDGSTLTPFLQLGGIYLNNHDRHTTSSSGDYLLIHQSEPALQSLAVLFGVGLDYQFSARVPSSINLNLAYSPLNIFRDSYNYEVTTSAGTRNIQLQGKLLQVMLSYRIHLNLGQAKQ